MDHLISHSICAKGCDWLRGWQVFQETDLQSDTVISWREQAVNTPPVKCLGCTENRPGVCKVIPSEQERKMLLVNTHPTPKKNRKASYG